MKRILFSAPAACAAMVLCGFTSLPEPKNQPPSLFLGVDPAETESALPADPNETSSRVVRINPVLLEPGLGSLQEPGSHLTANFFPDEEQTVVIDSVLVRGSGEFSCVGHIENVPGSSVILAASSGAVVGTFSIPWSNPMHVRYAGSGLHRVSQVTPLSGDWCGTTESVPVAGLDGPTKLDAGDETNEVPVIDFLVLYTPRTLVAAGGEAGINALMDFMVAENNNAYANSGIQARWNIAGRQLISYTESGSIQTDINWLRGDSTVSGLRTAHKADLVMLIVEYDRYGWAGIAGNNHTVFLRPVIALGQYTVTHEVGHLFGAGHDHFTCNYRANRGGCGAINSYSYGHRFQADGMTYATIMSYSPGIAIPYFSNPEVLFRGVPTGSSFATNAADNARAITQQAPTVARLLTATCRFELEALMVKVGEGAETVKLSVWRSGDLSRTGAVEVITVAGTAKAAVDYTHTAAKLTFATNQTSQSVSVSLVPDTLGEGDESFTVSLRNPGLGTALGLVSSTRVIITDDDLWLGFGASSKIVAESSNTVAIAVRRGGDTNAATQISYATEGITAVAGEDFAQAEGTLAFQPGEIEKSVSITLLPDTLAEPNEQVGVRLLNPTVGQLAGPELATVTILDDERPGSVDARFNGLKTWEGSPVCIPVMYGDGRFLRTIVFKKDDGSAGARLSRYLPDGSLDTQFAAVETMMTATPENGLPIPLGYPGVPVPAPYMVLDSQERILIGGWAASVNGTLRTNLFRLNPDGSLDSSFQAAIDCFAFPCPQPDGKILLSGSFHNVNGVTRPYFARLNADGSLDTTYNPKPNSDTITGGECVLQADGKILVTGGLWGFEGQTREYFARLNPDGSLDRLFKARPNGGVRDALVLPDQRILIAGGFTSPRNGIVLLKPDGSTDFSFNPSALNLNGPVYWVHRLPDGRIFIAGLFTGVGPTKQNYLIRLNPDGSLDTTFDTGTGPNDSVGFAVEPSGSLLVFGAFTSFNGLPVASLVRLNSDGTRPTFGPISVLAGGELRLKLFGNAGHSYEIEKSSDLTHWEKLRTETFTRAEFEWTQPSDSAALYFRAREATKPLTPQQEHRADSAGESSGS